MKTIIQFIIIVIANLSWTRCSAQLKNEKTAIVKVYGNCDMCKKTIEKAGSVKKVSKVIWNQDTKNATLKFDSKKTTENEILKRIALSGYDNEKYLAPDDAYAKLQSCCQYARNKKTEKTDSPKDAHEHHSGPKTEVEVNSLKTVIDKYFLLKDVLIKTDANSAALKAKDLLITVNAIKMEKLKTEEHNVWMKVLKNLTTESEEISKTKDIEKQRNAFMTLSINVYELIKVAKYPVPVYYQNCPMYNDGKGANWLSKENVIKNPYYGSQMMSCGKTTETIK